MRIIDVEQNSPEWLEARRGKITGTMLSDLYSKRPGHKIGFYEILADRLGLARDGEDRMERGHRLEQEAIDLYSEKTGKVVDRVGICVSDVNPNIINSPDGLIKEGELYTEAVEVKCLSPARHLQAVIENSIPDEFYLQELQYFIVNDDLKVLHFVFYDPSIPSASFLVLDAKREDVADEIVKYRQFQIDQLAEMDAIVERLAF